MKCHTVPYFNSEKGGNKSGCHFLLKALQIHNVPGHKAISHAATRWNEAAWYTKSISMATVPRNWRTAGGHFGEGLLHVIMHYHGGHVSQTWPASLINSWKDAVKRCSAVSVFFIRRPFKAKTLNLTLEAARSCFYANVQGKTRKYHHLWTFLMRVNLHLSFAICSNGCHCELWHSNELTSSRNAVSLPLRVIFHFVFVTCSELVLVVMLITLTSFIQFYEHS